MKIDAHLTELEMRLLIALRQRATELSEAGEVRVDVLAKDVGASVTDARYAASFLGGFELVSPARNEQSPSSIRTKVGIPLRTVTYSAIWLTAIGENYIRSIEAEPSVARRLSLQAWEQTKSTVMAVAQTALAEIVKVTIAAMARSQFG